MSKNNDVTRLLSLGRLHVSDFVDEKCQESCYPSDLTLVLDKNGAARLETTVPKERMYGKYWYRSGTNDTMRKNLKSVVDSVLEVKKLQPGNVWLDIACNDGTLLSFVPSDVMRIGIDPADDTYLAESQRHGEIVQDFFSLKAYRRSSVADKKCDVITTIAMFYDLEEPGKFLDDICELLSDDGVWVMQLSYTPLMIEQLAFDNICHEHVYYYSLFNLQSLFSEHGMKIVDAQLNDVNGGSVRVFVMKESANLRNFAKQPHRDVCNFRVQSLLAYEKSLNLDSISTWRDFSRRIETLKEQLNNFIINERQKGKTFWAYGASTKGNTLLQYFGLNSESIEAIAERNPMKYGLRTVGTNIPIRSESEMRERHPDYLIVLPWHFIDEFVDREDAYLKAGGKFVVPCPRFEIISWGD